MVKKMPDLKEYLKNSSYKFTGQRLAVLEVLFENNTLHLNADEIYRLLTQKNINIGIATVYRTLALLEKIKCITRINLDDGFIRYQLSDPYEKHEHHHLICERCNMVMDLEEDLLDSLEKQVFLKSKFRVSNHKVKLFGLCEKCYGNSRVKRD